MNADDATELDEDLESAYRKALIAVEAADLRQASSWHGRDDEEPDVLPFSPAKHGGGSSSSPPASMKQSTSAGLATDDRGHRVTPQQVLEAAIFVGGIELSAERLAGLLKGEFTSDFVVRTLEELNQKYAAEDRAYEIRREENLFRLALRDEFEPLRRRVYGLGPKDVKLGQETLEVLSLIAYRQPLSRAEIDSLREGSAANVLRQLVRRQLVAAQRAAEGGELVYVTTDRFLEVFGLAGLDELPRAESLSFK